MIPIVWHLGRGKNYGDSKEINGSWDLGEGRIIGGAERIFRAVKILCVIP